MTAEALCLVIRDQVIAINSAYSLLATQGVEDTGVRIRASDLLTQAADALRAVAGTLTEDIAIPPYVPEPPATASSRWRRDRPTPVPPPVAAVLRNYDLPGPVRPRPPENRRAQTVVHRPTTAGLRRVEIGGRAAGLAASADEVAAIMKQAGVDDAEIDWRGGGPTVWPASADARRVSVLQDSPAAVRSKRPEPEQGAFGGPEELPPRDGGPLRAHYSPESGELSWKKP